MSTASGLDRDWVDPPQPIPLHRQRLLLGLPPTPLTAAIGRDAEVASVRSLLAEREVRLVTLLGPGGIGKTRLALQIAAECAPDFDDQVAWASAAAATTREAVTATLARAVGIAEVGGRSTIEALKSALRDQRLLLIIDNFEQAVDAAPLLGDLLRSCPGLSMLVTSRALLRVAGERPVAVPPLAIDASPTTTDLPPAVQLFAQRAAGVAPSFVVNPANAPVIAEICRRLDGLPLAIELAAARCALFPPAALLARLDRRLPQLTGGRRDAPGRHRTMRDAIAWSHDLLTPDERAVFRCLGAFAGGCSLGAAEAVCRAAGRDDAKAGAQELDDPLAGIDVLSAIESLAAQSLIRVDPPATGDGAPQLTMLETVREFAAEQLAASGDDAPLRRHAKYYLDLALQVEPTYWGDTAGYPRTELDDEIENLRAARNWAVEHGDADTALRLISAMFDPHRMTGDHAREQWIWTQRALAIPGGSPDARADALVSAAWLALVGFDGGEAQALGEAALAQARQAGNSFGIAASAAALGVMTLHAGDETRARELLNDALTGFRRLEASGRIGWTLTHLAWLDSRDAVDEGGDPETLARAYAMYDEALMRFRALGHPSGIARAVHGLAYVAYKQRDLTRALAMTKEMLVQGWEQRWPVFSYLEDIADIAGRAGHAKTAALLYGAADAQRQQFGLPIEPPYREEYERDAAVARRALGPARFAESWEAGATLAPEQAVAEALAVTVQPTSSQSPTFTLTPREVEVLRLLADGLSDRAIAEALFIGERTVNTHVARIFTKLGVRNRAGAVAAAATAGIIDLPASSRNPS